MKDRKKPIFAVLSALVLTAAALSACAPANNAGTTGTMEEAGAEETMGKAGAEEISGNAGTEAETAEAGGPGTADAASLPDGTYTPASFTVQGGTGKVKITCPEVVLLEGTAQAVIEFSSPHYEWVKADGVQYEPENAGEKDRKNSVFRIPVVLDEEMKISGLTTAMSEPHEVEYTLLISLTQKENTDESGASGRGDGTLDVMSDSMADGSDEGAEAGKQAEQTGTDGTAEAEPPALPGLTCVSTKEKYFAEAFDIYTYKKADEAASSGEEYRLIDVHGSGRYLLLPEGSGTQGGSPAAESVIAGLPDSITVLEAPPDNIYVAATSSMALFDAAGALDQVTLTGTKADGWYIDAPVKALEEGRMTYAGKYSAPDYELLASSGCDLAVESMMILHTPEVKEKLEELGIPVFIDTSSTESHPLGRTEWVRLYGVLTGHEAEADAFFDRQMEKFAQSDSYTDTGLTVAFFSISSGGNVIVRASDDYIPRMIGLAGGKYIFDELLSGSGNSASVRLSMEDFYNTAKDADFLIYNATIESPVRSISELCGKASLLSDFGAVKSGSVWQVRRSLYQSPDIAAQMITDIHMMLTGQNTDEMVFLEQLP